MISVDPIKAFSDNYIWCLSNPEGEAWVVDPGDAAPVEEHLRQRDLTLQGVLITHHHFDHVGGVASLTKQRDIRVVGPQTATPEINEPVAGGDRITLLGSEFDVIAVPGHTLDHIAYYGNTLLFCGDTLFAGGCGRLFEGTPEQMHASLARISSLPGATRVYCAHEYTQANLAFAAAVEPDNTALQSRIQKVEQLRQQGLPTVPSQLADELATNPFLRADQPSVRDSAEEYASIRLSDDIGVFAEVRRWKDNF